MTELCIRKIETIDAYIEYINIPQLQAAIMTSTNATNKTLTLESILTFGKHSGKQVEDVLEDHPDYIQWMLDNEVREFDEETMFKFSEKGLKI